MNLIISWTQVTKSHYWQSIIKPIAALSAIITGFATMIAIKNRLPKMYTRQQDLYKSQLRTAKIGQDLMEIRILSQNAMQDQRNLVSIKRILDTIPLEDIDYGELNYNIIRIEQSRHLVQSFASTRQQRNFVIEFRSGTHSDRHAAWFANKIEYFQLSQKLKSYELQQQQQEIARDKLALKVGMFAGFTCAAAGVKLLMK